MRRVSPSQSHLFEFIGHNEEGRPSPSCLRVLSDVTREETLPITSPSLEMQDGGQPPAPPSRILSEGRFLPLWHHPSLLMFWSDGGDSQPSLPLHCIKVWDRGHLCITTPHLMFWCNRGDSCPSIASKCKMVSPILHFNTIEGVLSFPTPLSSWNMIWRTPMPCHLVFQPDRGCFQPSPPT